MYSILFSVLLASTYVSAIPVPLGALYEHQPDNNAERANKAAFTTSLTEANRQISNMQEVLKNPNDRRIRTAFGPNANHAEISKVVNTLATKKLKVQSMDPNMADNEAGKRPVNGFVPIKDGTPQSARFGSIFFGSNTQQQAGTIIHEATHQLARTGDHVDTTAKRIIPAGEPNPRNAQKNGGYAASLDPPTASTLGSKYETMRDTVSNTHQNADSYRVFAALCSRSLYKRALLEDDPVGYYLSKRSRCNLTPNYFAKKAAAKAATAKGSTTAAKKETISPATAIGKASSTKSTEVKGAKNLKGAPTKVAKANTVRKPTRKDAGATAGKGLKTVKSTKSAKGLTTTKSAKTAKEIKTAKAGKDLKAVKGSNAIKGVKSAERAKSVKAAEAGKGVKVAKDVKAAKGAKSTKRTESPKSVKPVKATQNPKSTAARKTTSEAKTAAKVATKSAGNVAVKATVPKVAAKVAGAIPKTRKNLRRDLGMIADDLE